VTINDTLPLKTAQGDAIVKLKSLGFESELQTTAMSFHL